MKLADKRLNGRYWFVAYPCGGWRVMPGWYADTVLPTYCEVRGHPMRPGHVGIAAVRVPRPPVGYPRHGVGEPPDYPSGP